MKILSFYYKNKAENIEIEPMEFDLFNILVGISGSGKTTIIKALSNIVEIATGQYLHSCEWDITYLADDQSTVQWRGCYSDKTETKKDKENTFLVADLLKEELIINELTILKNDQGVVSYNNTTLPQLDSTLSLFYQLRNDHLLNEIYRSFRLLRFINEGVCSPFSQFFATLEDLEQIEELCKKDKYCISQRKFDTAFRIYFSSLYDLDKMEHFNALCSSIFPEVKKIIPRLSHSFNLPGLEKEARFVSIDLELSSGTTVRQNKISAGMFKTIILLAELVFGPKASPIIIDEIENGLGVNCLPNVIDELFETENQVIMTSHHPQVINTIKPKFWKIITRKGSLVQANSADALENASSSHDNFVQLINSSFYRS